VIGAASMHGDDPQFPQYLALIKSINAHIKSLKRTDHEDMLPIVERILELIIELKTFRKKTKRD
jgi:hypothetical protein